MDIRYIAKLAALRVKEDELEKLGQDMETIMAMVENLPDTSDDLPSESADAMTLREDIVLPSGCTREDILRNAPEIKTGCVVVPKMVE